MRILHIGKFFPPYPGGVESYTAALSTASARAGIATAVLAHAPPHNWHTQRRNVQGVEVTLAACLGQWVYVPLSPSFPWQLMHTIRSFRPDLVHLHVPNVSVFFALLSPAARRLPWVIHWHADVPLDARDARLRAAYRLYRPWEQAVLRRARAIIATSEPYRDSSPALAPWRDKVSVIPLGLGPSTTTQIARAPEWPTSGLRLLAVGRLTYYKGFDVLLRALAQLESASLVLIGGGEQESDLRALAIDLGIQQRVLFCGNVDDATLEAAYAAAEAFCLPSIERSEAFGLVLLEAMRARLPVVASAIPGSGVNVVVEHGRTGFLVEPNNPRALAQALEKLAGDATLRQSMGAQGNTRWQREFSLAKVTEQTLELYRRVLAIDPDHATITPPS
jgi:glycosyltransferase involved in cell wall biosynthesis